MFSIKNDKKDDYNFCITLMLGAFSQLGVSADQLSSQIQLHNLIKDPSVLPHLASILSNIDKAKSPNDLVHLSNIIKQTQPNPMLLCQGTGEIPVCLHQITKNKRSYQMISLENQLEKIKWAGFGIPKQEAYLLENHIRNVAENTNASEIRFFGKILGTMKDYYVLQGIKNSEAELEEIPAGSEKRGEGVNYYTFWVSTNLMSNQWAQLPLIRPHHVKVARQIKFNFTGHLNRALTGFPNFDGLEKHYLKAQLVRMISSLEIVPKGIYKVNDENPKTVEFQDEPKVPQFGQLSSIETWVHLNPNLLGLGRYTHYIDPATPEEQLEAVTAELTEKDPQIQRLRGITEDKLPEGNVLGLENIWQVRIAGDSQVFQKDQASNVYAVALFKNVLWPGWVTIGYKGGYCNYYTGYGTKWTQPTWSQHSNPDLAEQAQDPVQCHEPNPKEEPKPVQQVVGAPEAEEEG